MLLWKSSFSVTPLGLISHCNDGKFLGLKIRSKSDLDLYGGQAKCIYPWAFHLKPAIRKRTIISEEVQKLRQLTSKQSERNVFHLLQNFAKNWSTAASENWTPSNDYDAQTEFEYCALLILYTNMRGVHQQQPQKFLYSSIFFPVTVHVLLKPSKKKKLDE